MPSRQNVVRIDTDVVQGDKSYVKLRRMTVAEMKESFRDSDKERTTLEAFTDTLKSFIDHVVEWNWVDDDGNPLPQPSEDPSVVDLLTSQEILFLGESLAGETDSKN